MVSPRYQHIKQYNKCNTDTYINVYYIYIILSTIVIINTSTVFINISIIIYNYTINGYSKYIIMLFNGKFNLPLFEYINECIS